MMRVFLTGASGFIGTHLKQWLSSDYEVTELQGDVCDYNNINEQLKFFSPHIIVHLAARTEVEKSFYEPESFSQVNYTGTVNMIEAARQSCPDLKLFLFSSTMETYGWQPVSDEIRDGKIPNEIPVFDESTPQHPNAPYAVAKLACEKYLEYASRAFGLPFCALRQTNTYGRKDNDFFVVEQIITQMLKSEEIINLGDPRPWRNFLFIDDLLELYKTVILNPEKSQGQFFCTGPANALSIEDLVKLIASKLNWHGEVQWFQKPERKGEIFLLNSTEKHASNVLGWEPKVSLNEGLDRTINLWKQALSEDESVFDSTVAPNQFHQ